VTALGNPGEFRRGSLEHLASPLFWSLRLGAFGSLRAGNVRTGDVETQEASDAKMEKPE